MFDRDAANMKEFLAQYGIVEEDFHITFEPDFLFRSEEGCNRIYNVYACPHGS